MDANVVLGGLALLFGLVTLVARFVAPDSKLFSKLGPMKERYGDAAGTAIHVVAYTVVPLAIGAGLIVQALTAVGDG